MKFRSLLLAVGLAGATIVGLAGPAHADIVPSGCTNARQLGSTAYVTNSAGARIASVKQYYGVCGGAARNWSYVFVWQSFYDTGRAYTIKAGIITADSGNHPIGARNAGRPARELVSAPVATTGVCTRAWGGLDLSTGSRTAQTGWDC